MREYLNFKQANCKNCYKCLRECPVKAITVINDRARIRDELCVLCGHCTGVCAFNAKEVVNDTAAVKKLLAGKKKVIASVAPAFAASFVPDFAAFKAGLLRLGFADAFETAGGAREVTDRYLQCLRSGKYRNLIASACPSIVRLIRLYYPDALPYLAPVVSPMVAHGKLLRARYPDAKIVFIGPCIAKKREADESGEIDAALTFEEVNAMFVEGHIDIAGEAEAAATACAAVENNCGTAPKSVEENDSRTAPKSVGENDSRTAQKSVEETDSRTAQKNAARYYPINRGIIKSFDSYCDGYEYISVDGLARAKEVLGNIDTLSGMFIEMHACEFSCINGPCALHKQKGGFIKATETVRAYAKTGDEAMPPVSDTDLSYTYKKIEDKRRMPTEEEIRKILEATGKFTPEDELNCGACGYNTCREKAIAVYNGMAEISMCVPYMRERAEGLSYDIIQNSPNGILALDSELCVTEVNEQAAQMLGASKATVKGEPIEKYCNPADFYAALYDNEFFTDKKVQLDRSGKWVEMTIRKVRNQNLLFCIMKDITKDVDYSTRIGKIKEETVAAADAVVKKQMRVVQEIASLLGETTAETKIALLKLRDTIATEERGEE